MYCQVTLISIPVLLAIKNFRSQSNYAKKLRYCEIILKWNEI